MNGTNDRAIFLQGRSPYDTSHSGASVLRKQLSNWMPARLPADADLLPDLPALQSRARDLDRNNGVAAGGLQTLQDNVAGYGLRLAAYPDWRALGQTVEWAADWSQNTEALWRSWADTCACDVAHELTFSEMTKLVFRSALENGEALALPLWQARPETPFRTCIQLIESDRLGNPVQDGMLGYGYGAWAGGGLIGAPVAANGRRVIGGIERDDFGRPLAYYIRTASDYWGFGSYLTFAPEDWERIPAETSWGRKRVLHMHSKERIAQSRGRPLLTPVIEQFRMLDSYERTELQSAIVNAIVAGVIETPATGEEVLSTFGGDVNAYLASKNQYRVRLEGGSMIPLYPGDKMTPFIPARPAAQFPSFVEAISRQIGTAIGMPYELVLKDFSKTNYSSARAALMEAWRFFIVRRHWLANSWAMPIYRLWLEEAVNAGMIEAPDFYKNQYYYTRSKWIGMGRGWIDPVKEAEAAQLRMEISISTLEQECAEQGQDWREVLEQRALETARIDQLGLPQPGPYQKSPPTGEQPVPAQQPGGGGPPQ